MASHNIASQGFVDLLEKAVTFAMQVYGGKAENSLENALETTSKEVDSTASSTQVKGPEIIAAIDSAKALATDFEEKGDIKFSDQAIAILQEKLSHHSSANDPDSHHIIFALALILCRRVESQLSNKTNATESMLILHQTLARCVFLLRQAVNSSPPDFEIKVRYLAQLGHTCTLWSTVMSSHWPEAEVLALLAYLKADHDGDQDAEERMSGFVSAVILASTLSTAFGITKNVEYRDEGRDVYRNTLRSMRDALPIDTMINPTQSMDLFQQISALLFIKDGVIPFIVQVMAVLMQSLVEVPLSAVVGRRAAAVAMGKGFYTQGVEWLEQCLMLVWGQLNLRAPTPLAPSGIQTDWESGMGLIVHAFLGLCIYIDVVGDKGTCIAHPEQLAYFLIQEWLKRRQEALRDPIFKDLFKQHSFDHFLNAARTAPVVMLNLWGIQCDAVILYGEGKHEHFALEGVTEEFVAKLQSTFREGLRSDHFRSRGDETSDEYRGSMISTQSSAIHRVLGALWKKIVKPIFDKMGLVPISDPELDPPRLAWCPTGPMAFFPLHAAGLYGRDALAGTKSYEYVASSYTPTLTIMADASVTLESRKSDPFKGILAVSQPTNDGQTPIPMTVSEVETLLSAIESIKASDSNVKIPCTWLKQDGATKAAVLAGMSSSTWVHLACHALQYPLNTSESAFMLANGEVLSLADISSHASADGELAFLSACQTAAGDFDVSEEGVHLAAGMLVAGYRGVIATTWSVRDQDAPIVAKGVYERLLGGGKISRSGSALALHHGTRLLREKVGQDEVMRWAPFVHLGI